MILRCRGEHIVQTWAELSAQEQHRCSFRGNAFVLHRFGVPTTPNDACFAQHHRRNIGFLGRWRRAHEHGAADGVADRFGGEPVAPRPPTAARQRGDPGFRSMEPGGPLWLSGLSSVLIYFAFRGLVCWPRDSLAAKPPGEVEELDFRRVSNDVRTKQTQTTSQVYWFRGQSLRFPFQFVR